MTLTYAALALPMLDPSPVTPPGVSENVNTFLGWMMWAGGATAVLALIVAGIIIMLNSMGRAGDGAERIVKILGYIFIGGVIVGSAGVIGSAIVPGV